MTALEDALPGLEEHRRRLDPLSMRRLLGRKDRFNQFSARAGDLFLDYSKNKIDRDALAALIALAGASGVTEKRNAMFEGAPINTTEGRAVMHVALRADSAATFEVNGTDIMPGIRSELDRMTAFAEGVRSGDIVGETEAFIDVVNIGIGGSDLGPAMATLALRPFHDGPRLHFVSNVDGAHIADTLDGLDPARTLFLVASKTFTTIETMTNAMTARNWLATALGDDAVGRHFAAMSAAVDQAAAFGVEPDRVFGFGDWIGGRYSLWSTIGLPLAIAIGNVDFRDFLGGARTMDAHFVGAPFGANLPCLLALVGIWNRNVCNFPALAILPYDQRLARLPAYLQQLDMESNGKSVATSGETISFETGPLVFGEPGTNGQHAFYQFLHQGTDVTPCDFLVAAEGHEGWPEHHDQLVASCLAQSEALSWGKTQDEAVSDLAAAGHTAQEAASLAPHKTFPGDRPSNTIVYRKMTPSVLGQLIALYEHKVLVQGTIWGVDSFDQWGVELGKQLATGLVEMVRSGSRQENANTSTAGLLEEIARLRREPSAD